MNLLMSFFSLMLILFSTQINSAVGEEKLSAAVVTLNSSYKVDTVWATAYQATITLTNNTSSPTSNWTSTFTMPQGYVLSTHVSNGIFTTSGQNVTVKNTNTNGVIAAGGSTKFTVMINMPLSKPTVINNLQAVANGSVAPPVKVPVAPKLNSIKEEASGNYIVSWNAVADATSYLLQQDTTASFSNPTTAVQGNVLSSSFTNKAAGTYYYRVLAINSVGKSPFSNVQNVTISQTPPVIPQGIEHSVWYIDWTSWFTGPPYVLPANVNMINVFVGKIMYGADGKPTLGGFGNMTEDQMTQFTAYCAAQQPPIAVKVSIGGAGGMYDHCWDLLTTSNVASFAQGAADYCRAHGLVGVDFDYEAFTSDEQETLVGKFIKEFKAIDPKFQTSLCVNAGFGPNYPWQAAAKNVLDAATISSGKNAVDRLYIMSYYDPIQDEQKWINGWANWVKETYGFTPARVSVGIDDFDAHAYDPVVFAAWAASQGYSTAHWAFDPANPK